MVKSCYNLAQKLSRRVLLYTYLGLSLVDIISVGADLYLLTGDVLRPFMDLLVQVVILIVQTFKRGLDGGELALKTFMVLGDSVVIELYLTLDCLKVET